MLSVWECAAEEELNGNWVNNQEQELLNVILVKGEDNVVNGAIIICILNFKSCLFPNGLDLKIRRECNIC